MTSGVAWQNAGELVRNIDRQRTDRGFFIVLGLPRLSTLLTKSARICFSLQIPDRRLS